MEKNILLESVKKLNQIPKEALKEYSAKRERLTTELNTLMLARKDLNQLVGELNIQMMLDNHNNHSMFMESVFTLFNPEVLVETILWVFRAYRSHGFSRTYWPAQLEAWLVVLKEQLPPNTFEEIYPYYRWMIVNIPVFTLLSENNQENK